MTASRRTVRTGNPRVDVRHLLDTSVGARVLLYREDVEALLAFGAPDPAPAESILLVPGHDELVAEAAWSSAPARVAEHGPWDTLAEDDPRRQAHLAAARRLLHYLFTGTVLPEETAPQPAPRTT